MRKGRKRVPNPGGNSGADREIELFWTKVIVPDDPEACWGWSASVTECGYGSHHAKSIPGTSRLAHRLSWIIHNGPIPGGLHVLHRCDTRDCCNPAHLWLGTQADNMHDKKRKGRARSSFRDFIRVDRVAHMMAMVRLMSTDQFRALLCYLWRDFAEHEAYQCQPPR